MNNLVVLVDDDSVTNVLNEKIIREAGYPCDVVIVEDSREALIFLTNNITDEYDESYIFLDYKMPNLNGIDVLRQIDERVISNESVQLFFLTSSDTDALLMKISSNPRVTKVLPKPLTREIVQSIFESHHPELKK